MFTTSHEYYRNIYVRHDDFDASDTFGVPVSNPLVPCWRVKDIETDVVTNDQNGVNDIEDDDTYEKRHSKFEVEEKRLIKKDQLMKDIKIKVIE